MLVRRLRNAYGGDGRKSQYPTGTRYVQVEVFCSNPLWGKRFFRKQGAISCFHCPLPCQSDQSTTPLPWSPPEPSAKPKRRHKDQNAPCTAHRTHRSIADAGNCSATEGLQAIFHLKGRLATTDGGYAWSSLIQAVGDLMDHDENALSPTALAWDRDGELRSEDLECLRNHLHAEEISPQRQGATVHSRRRSRRLMPQTPLCQPLLLGGVQ